MNILGKVDSEDSVPVKIEVKTDSASTVIFYTDSIGNYSLELDLDHFYEIKFQKADYYPKGFYVDSRFIPEKRKNSKFSKIQAHLKLYKKNSLISENEQPAMMIYRYNQTKQNFEYEKSQLDKVLQKNNEFTELLSLIDKNPLLKNQLENYTKNIASSELKIQEEIYKNNLKEQEISKKALELNQSKLLNEKKQNELNLIAKQKKIQELELIEKQNSLIKKEIENERKSKQIALMSALEIQNKLNLSKKEIALKQSKIEIDNRENALNNIKKDQLLKDAEIKRQDTIRLVFIIGTSLLLIITLIIVRSLIINRKKIK